MNNRAASLCILIVAVTALPRPVFADTRNPGLPDWVTSEQLETYLERMSNLYPDRTGALHETNVDFDSVQIRSVGRGIAGGPASIELVTMRGGVRKDLRCDLVSLGDGSIVNDSLRVERCQLWRAAPDPAVPGSAPGWYFDRFFSVSAKLRRGDLSIENEAMAVLEEPSESAAPPAHE